MTTNPRAFHSIHSRDIKAIHRALRVKSRRYRDATGKHRYWKAEVIWQFWIDGVPLYSLNRQTDQPVDLKALALTLYDRTTGGRQSQK